MPFTIRTTHNDIVKKLSWTGWNIKYLGRRTLLCFVFELRQLTSTVACILVPAHRPVPIVTWQNRCRVDTWLSLPLNLLLLTAIEQMRSELP